jgi:hypothetical protein
MQIGAGRLLVGKALFSSGGDIKAGGRSCYVRFELIAEDYDIGRSLDPQPHFVACYPYHGYDNVFSQANPLALFAR